MSKFLHDDNDATKAIAIPPVFSENSQADNGRKGKHDDYQNFSIVPEYFYCLSSQGHYKKKTYIVR